MGLTQSSFIFLTLIFFAVSITTSPVYAIRQQKQHSLSKIYSLSLHHRDSIIKPQNSRDKAARKHSLIQRDLDRVESINARIKHAISTSNSDSGDNLQTPLTPIASNSEYAARIWIGTPAKEFYMVPDTGSDVNWIQCLPCAQCYNQTHPIFDPSKSSTYRPEPCGSDLCKLLGKTELTSNFSAGSNSTCSYTIQYGSGASEGNFVTETLSFGGSVSFPNVAIGCAHNSVGFDEFDGLLGMDPVKISLPAQLNSTSFSYCLINPDSNRTASTLDFNSPMPADSIVISYIRNPAFDLFYYVELTGITVGKHQIPVPESAYKIGKSGSGGIIVDSGTTLTYLPVQTYALVRDAFRNETQHLPGMEHFFAYEGMLETCYNISSENLSSLNNLPGMSFHFSNGKKLPLSQENYFLNLEESETGEWTAYCLPLNGFTSGPYIIGNIQQQGMRVTYDLSKKLIGFSPNKC